MKKFILIGVAVIVLASVAIKMYRDYNTEKNRPLTFKEAGTDFTKTFNAERVKKGLPPIPENWHHIFPLDYAVQIWENPDTIPPRYAEKTVSAGIKAQIENEEDRYELKRMKDFSYQLVIVYDYHDGSTVCTLRNTKKPENGIPFEGDVLNTLTKGQAIDTLRAYGITR